MVMQGTIDNREGRRPKFTGKRLNAVFQLEVVNYFQTGHIHSVSRGSRVTNKRICWKGLRMCLRN